MVNPAPLKTRLTELLGCDYPIVQAGMGGPGRSELCAAVSSAGAFGCIGMVKESPELVRREIAAVPRTHEPFVRCKSRTVRYRSAIVERGTGRLLQIAGPRPGFLLGRSTRSGRPSAQGRLFWCSIKWVGWQTP